jgi:predicted AlkP superfamily pyrophosphatase or phosphodiesterase
MGTNKSRHLVLVSYDAFSEDNWALASRLPHLSKLIKNGAYSLSVNSVYPSLTYPAHTSIVTGVYPEKHGIYHNNPFQPFVPEGKQSWFWFRRDVKVPTIYDTLNKHGMTSAAILWPVTGKAKINYNMPEIRAIKNENQIFKVLKNGSPLYCLSMEGKFGNLRRGIEQPYLDDFAVQCAAETIRRKKPNLLLLHLTELDEAKHEHGTMGPHIEKVLFRMDFRLGKLIKAVEEVGLKDDTTFIVIGDHGQLDVKYKVRLNKLLKDRGLIYDENGILKWKAYIQSCGGSAYLHIKNGDKAVEQEALEILRQAVSDGSYGIEKLYSGSDLSAFHAYPYHCYMLEAKAGYCFEDEAEDPIIINSIEQGIKHATHGYKPDKPYYKSVMVISGNNIKKNYLIGSAELTDIAPTMASILGLAFPSCDGRALNEVYL